MALFSKKSKIQNNVQNEVLDQYTVAVTNWCQALASSQRQGAESEFTSRTLTEVGKPAPLQSDRIANAVSRDLCIVTARKWVTMEVGKFARQATNTGGQSNYWDQVHTYLIDALPRTTTL